MTKQEYREALHEINVKAENERRVLARAFATEHSPVNVGDYISDHYDIVIEQGIMSKEELDKALDPKEMLQSHKFTLK